MPDSLPEHLQKLVNTIRGNAGPGARAELDARLAVAIATPIVGLIEKTGVLAQKVENTSTAIAGEVDRLTAAIEKGASALNETVRAGNRLTTKIGYLTAVGVGLALVSVLGTGIQVAIAWGCIGPRAVPSASTRLSSPPAATPTAPAVPDSR